MKPVKITMQAFGPYRNEAEVDFSLLGCQPIFLITGSTGGGKTTILDAMCFALYCKATGGRRSWDSMRTNSISDETATFVDFVFRLGDCSYRFYRSRTIYYKRGSGERAVKEEHICYIQESGEWNLLLSGSESRVRDYAQQLLNLTCEQFSQVIVLPQGDFLKLLRASSVEKAEILQTLFATRLWQDITKAAKDRTDRLASDAQEFLSARNALLKREEVSTCSELKLLLQDTSSIFQCKREEFQQAQKTLQATNTMFAEILELHRKFELFQKLQLNLDQLNLQKEAVDGKQKKLENGRMLQRLLPYLDSVKNAELDLEKKLKTTAVAERRNLLAQSSLKKLETEAEKLPAMQTELAELLKKRANLNTAYQNALRLEGQQQKLNDKLTERDCKVKQEQALLACFNTAEKNLLNGREYIDRMQKNIRLLPEYLLKVQRLKEQKEAFTSLTLKETEYKTVLEKQQKSFHQEQTSQVKLNSIKLQLQQMEAIRLKNSAGSLALTLKEGQPCPVCGSHDHPLPCITADIPFSIEQLELLQAALAEEDTLHQQLSKVSAIDQIALERTKTELKSLQDLCSTISSSLSQITADLEKAEALLQQAQKDATKIPQAEQRLNQRMQEREEAQHQLEQRRTELQQLERELSGLISSKEELLRTLESSKSSNQIQTELAGISTREAQLRHSSALLETQLQSAKTEAVAAKEAKASADQSLSDAQATFENSAQHLKREELAAGLLESPDYSSVSDPAELEQLQNEIQQFQAQHNSIAQQFCSCKTELIGKEKPDLDLVKAQQKQAQQKNDELSQNLGSLQNRVGSLQTAVNQYEELAKKGEASEQLYSQAARLSLLLSGKNSHKVPLQQFVLGIMLDDILSSCNQFFSTLSRGRYSLNRIVGSVSGNALSGLDLQVLDAQTGGARSIETLSGGEQFLASLSLAFGLSDVVQAHSGSVRLDSIFIDEGFGTLDQETLDTAMKALAQIQKAGRTVGIISHVTELKQHIAAHIEIFEDCEKGSCIKIKTE